ncbi:MAG: hypothetical protein J6A37_08265 [Oscillospiraceae bacterium]|nr:hypothetical protein [Oscillospiraceae bacterium]
MPRVKKSAVNLAEQNKKIADEIAKLEARMKANSEKIRKEQLNRIENSGIELEDVVELVEMMSIKNISVQDILSLIDDTPPADEPETSQKSVENEKITENITADEKALDEMLATLPSYDT